MRLNVFYPSKNLWAYDPMSKQPVQGGIESDPGPNGIKYEMFEDRGSVWVIRWGARDHRCPPDSSEKTAFVAKYSPLGVAYFWGGAAMEKLARDLAEKFPPPAAKDDLDEDQSARSGGRRKASQASA